MKESVKRTYTPGVVGDLGGFGGLYSLAGHSMSEPMLVSGTDGVGTKLRLAIMMDKHDTIGQDCVAMSVNDILCARGNAFILPRLYCSRQVGSCESSRHRARCG